MRGATGARGRRPLAVTHRVAVRESLAALRESPFLLKTDAVRGYVYEVETGKLREVPATDQAIRLADQRDRGN